MALYINFDSLFDLKILDNTHTHTNIHKNLTTQSQWQENVISTCTVFTCRLTASVDIHTTLYIAILHRSNRIWPENPLTIWNQNCQQKQKKEHATVHTQGTAVHARPATHWARFTQTEQHTQSEQHTERTTHRENNTQREQHTEWTAHRVNNTQREQHTEWTGMSTGQTQDAQ